MERRKTVWEENSPESLLDLASRFCLNHPETFTATDPQEPGTSGRRLLYSSGLASATDEASPPPMTLLPGLHLPMEICEKLLSIRQDEGLDIDDTFAGVFGDPTTTRLRSVCVRGTSLGDDGLRRLLRHGLRELDIHNCEALSRRSLESLNDHGDSLLSLTIGNSVHVLPDYIYSRAEADRGMTDSDDDEDSVDEEDRQRTTYDERGYILRTPALQRFCVRDLFVTRGQNYFQLLFKPMTRLTHLDITGLYHNEGTFEFEFFQYLPRLISLVMHNVVGLETAVKAIGQLSNLRHLDISQSEEKSGSYDDPNGLLSSLVESLPELRSLDISGTNLAGSGIVDGDYRAAAAAAGAKMPQSDIPGLSSRVATPLDFIGLYKTSHEACTRAHIPAKEISGDGNEKQTLSAGHHYLDRPSILENVLNDLFHVFRYEHFNDVRAALDVILIAMDRHPEEKVIQISGSASLYYVVKSEAIRKHLNVRVKRKVLCTLLNGMFAHKQDPVMMRNGCLTLCQFTIPQDVLFDYERLVRILLFIVAEHTTEESTFVQRAGIFLLNSLACQVDGQQKLLVGDLGAMEKMLQLIRARIHDHNCDDVMETAWSTMWNVTDETPVNCQRFLDGGGMHLFLRCKEEFPDKQDLLRNMMGLLGNVAEVPTLRRHLMTKEFVLEFSTLLDSTSDGIEVSYNAAGVLAHMSSDGALAWTIDEPSRDDVLGRMVAAIERWNLDTKRNINYRSFEPILRLVRVTHTPQCQHWAVWALANLTRVDSKYCRLVEVEGGLSLLEELINSNVPMVSYPRVRELASIVRDNVCRWKDLGGQDLGPDGDALDLDG